MQFPVKTGSPTEQKTACAILPLFENGALSGASKAMDKASGGLIRRMIRSGDAAAEAGKALLVHDTHVASVDRLLLVGCGNKAEFGPKQYVAATADAVRRLAETGVRDAVSYLGYDTAPDIDHYYAARLGVQAARTATYRFGELKSRKAAPPKLSRLGLAFGDAADARAARRGVKDGTGIADGMDLARDLGNRPANVCTPTHLAETAKGIAERYDNMQVKILEERDIKRLGMGAFLSVTAGSKEPPKLIVLQYRGADRKSAPIALCGKGITFDSGGISLKPPPKMDEMKYDMCGAAGVLGTMQALGTLQPALNAVAVVPTCENMPGGRATRPGDIVTSMSGQTVEILNTDAEGRLILSDALHYACEQFKPRYLLDVATLTGSCVVALGSLYSALFTKDDVLAEQLLAAGARSRDAAWRMPVDAEYGESLKSNFADFANAGAREGGASIAAQFLSRFVGDARWAHLDIAGVAWHSNANKGATGRPVPLLVDFLLHLPS
jgi:leucyl aminopeptidase